MGLHGCCYRCLKYLVLICNFIFWLLGLAVLVIALWLFFDSTGYMQVSKNSDDFYKGLYVFIAIGFMMLVVGFLGCCGALKESQCMLCSFFVFLLIIFVAEVTVGVLAVQNKEELTKIFKDSISELVDKEYTGSQDDHRTVIFDHIQMELQCCGANGYQDWRSSTFNNKGGRVNLGPLSGLDTLTSSYQVPRSCCHRGVSGDQCNQATNIDPGTSLLDSVTGNIVPRSIYTEGCTDKLIDVLQTHLVIFIGVVIAVAVIEVLGMLFSMILCCAIRRLDDMKV